MSFVSWTGNNRSNDEDFCIFGECHGYFAERSQLVRELLHCGGRHRIGRHRIGNVVADTGLDAGWNYCIVVAGTGLGTGLAHYYGVEVEHERFVCALQILASGLNGHCGLGIQKILELLAEP